MNTIWSCTSLQPRLTNLSSLIKSTVKLIKRAAFRTHGSDGPSVLEADEWGRLFKAFGQASVNLRECVARPVRRVATAPYNACRLPFDKCSGVTPISVCEALRRVIGNAIVDCLSADLMLLSKK